MADKKEEIGYKRYNPAFKPSWDRPEQYVVIMGGAGSGKSVFVAQKMLAAVERGERVLVVRKVRANCKVSTFQLFKDIIYDLKLAGNFDINHTDMSIRNRLTNGMIIHAGMDDPEKIKSIAAINHIWIEEASDLNEADLSQLDLRLRGMGKKQIHYTFNPVPASRRIFEYLGINTERLPEHVRGCYRFETPIKNSTKTREIWYQHTTYLDNPFLGDDSYETRLMAQDDAQRRIYMEGMLAEEGAWDLVIQHENVKQAIESRPQKHDGIIRIGADPSEGMTGGDNATVSVVEGYDLIELFAMNKDPIELGDFLHELAQHYHAQADNIAVDGVGVGTGTIKYMKSKYGMVVTNVKAGRKPIEYDDDFGGEIEYYNLRAQMWWYTRVLLRAGEASISVANAELLDQLRADLTAPRYKRRSEKMIEVEPKDPSGGLAAIGRAGGFTWGVRQRLGRSTDLADSYIQALFVDYIKEKSWLCDTDYYGKEWTDPLAA